MANESRWTLHIEAIRCAIMVLGGEIPPSFEINAGSLTAFHSKIEGCLGMQNF
jgi:hypothetical protein